MNISSAFKQNDTPNMKFYAEAFSKLKAKFNIDFDMNKLMSEGEYQSKYYPSASPQEELVKKLAIYLFLNCIEVINDPNIAMEKRKAMLKEYSINTAAMDQFIKSADKGNKIDQLTKIFYKASFEKVENLSLEKAENITLVRSERIMDDNTTVVNGVFISFSESLFKARKDVYFECAEKEQQYQYKNSYHWAKQKSHDFFLDGLTKSGERKLIASLKEKPGYMNNAVQILKEKGEYAHCYAILDNLDSNGWLLFTSETFNMSETKKSEQKIIIAKPESQRSYPGDIYAGKEFDACIHNTDEIYKLLGTTAANQVYLNNFY